MMAQIRREAPKIFFQVPSHFRAVPPLVSGHFPICLLATVIKCLIGMLTDDGDSPTAWQKNVISCIVYTSRRRPIDKIARNTISRYDQVAATESSSFMR